MNQLFYKIYKILNAAFESVFECAESFFSKHLFAEVINVDNGNMKHARAIEFDYTNLLAML